MLVILSDVHLTDGTCGTTIKPRAFDKFRLILQDVVGKNPKEHGIDKVHLLLLGDIFDVIRSSRWVQDDQDPHNPIRPWSKDNDGHKLQNYTEEIVHEIIKKNKDVMSYIRKFESYCAHRGVEVEISYVIGNHDWLINQYPSTRQEIAHFLGLPNVQDYEVKKFPEYQVFPEYGVFARHGDCFDWLNFLGKRDASSLGDAIVIDLLSRFPEEVNKSEILKEDQEKKKQLYEQLKELDNVRPLLDIPAWIKSVCSHYSKEVEDKVHGIWNKLAGEFFKIPFVKDNSRFGLEMALRLTSGCTISALMHILAKGWIRRGYQRMDDYRPHAYKEIKDSGFSYVVYGHTHGVQQIALNRGEKGREKIYFNSGTWRQVFEYCYDQKTCEFLGWHVMTFLVFYLLEEKEPERKYEVWSASLGLGR